MGANRSRLSVYSFAIAAAALATAQSPPDELADGAVQEPISRTRGCVVIGSKACSADCFWPRATCAPDGGARPRARSAVVVSAWGRSGTTFLGELLQRNRRFLYHYEPLRVLVRGRAVAGLELLATANASSRAIRRLVDCAPALHIDRLQGRADPAAAVRGGLCGLDGAEAAAVCRCTDAAIKTIRLNGMLETLFLTLRSPTAAAPAADASSERAAAGWRGERPGAAPAVSVHVVQLVRDPRALLASWQELQAFRKHFNRHTSVADTVKVAAEICDASLADARAGLYAERAPSAPGARVVRYTLLRYEDLALRPVETARALYRRLGLALPPRLLSWVVTSTSAAGANRSSSRRGGAGGRPRDDAHATVRDAAQVVDKWRAQLAPRHARAITKTCRRFLQANGYAYDLTARAVTDARRRPDPAPAEPG